MSNTSQAVEPTELIGRLLADEDGSVRDAAIVRISEKMAQIKRALDSGVPPEEFQALNKALVALDHAKAVVAIAWVKFRKPQAK